MKTTPTIDAALAALCVTLRALGRPASAAFIEQSPVSRPTAPRLRGALLDAARESLVVARDARASYCSVGYRDFARDSLRASSVAAAAEWLADAVDYYDTGNTNLGDRLAAVAMGLLQAQPSATVVPP